MYALETLLSTLTGSTFVI